MAVTAHWLELMPLQNGKKKVNLKANLIAFLHVPGGHGGERLAKVFHFIINRAGLAKKVIFFFYHRSLANFFCLRLVG